LNAASKHPACDWNQRHVTSVPLPPVLGGIVIATVVWTSDVCRYTGLGIPGLGRAFGQPTQPYWASCWNRACLRYRSPRITATNRSASLPTPSSAGAACRHAPTSAKNQALRKKLAALKQGCAALAGPAIAGSSRRPPSNLEIGTLRCAAHDLMRAKPALR